MTAFAAIEDVSDDSADMRDIDGLMAEIGRAARAASTVLATCPPEAKSQALAAIADGLEANTNEILAANARDLARARDAGRTASFLDRLTLTGERIAGIAAGVRDVAALADPVGDEIARWRRSNGLDIARVRTPLGVIGVIYESRPNVTVDAGILCLKSGNAAILRGGSESAESAAALHRIMVAGLVSAGLPAEAIQLVPTQDRAAVGAMLAGLDGAIDVIVPRGGKSLVARVEAEARVPVFAHLDGNNHVYVHQSAGVAMAVDIVVNSKMRRTSVCGAAETLVIDEAACATHLPAIATALAEAGCALRGDATVTAAIPGIDPAGDADWATEYLEPILAIRAVPDVMAAIDHIARHGSHHTDAIVAEDPDAVSTFLSRVDSAIVLHNASTQFADGGEFGMGAEIGIATGRMHARGPVGVEQLTSFKYVVRGAGQTRP